MAEVKLRVPKLGYDPVGDSMMTSALAREAERDLVVV